MHLKIIPCERTAAEPKPAWRLNAQIKPQKKNPGKSGVSQRDKLKLITVIPVYVPVQVPQGAHQL